MSNQANVQSAITAEFANLFTALSARVEVFQSTQSDYLEELRPQIKLVLQELDEQETSVAVAIYGICLTDDAIKNYEIFQFADDIKYLQSLITDDEIEEETVTEETIVEESKLDPPKDERSVFQPPDHLNPLKKKELTDEERFQRAVSLKPIPSAVKEEPSTWTSRAQEAIATETKFMKVLTAYYQSNVLIEKVLIDFNHDLILHQTNERPELVITSLLIREHLLRLFEDISKIFLRVPIIVDLRYIAAQIHVAFNRIIKPDQKSQSQAEIFESIAEWYPLAFGDDLYWDLSEQVIYSKFYLQIKEILQPQIDQAKEERDKTREVLKNVMEGSKARPQQGSMEQLRAGIDSLIFESFHFNRPFDVDRRTKMQKSTESVLKRMALLEYGSQDIPNMDRYSQYFDEELFFPIFNEYKQLYLPFVDVRYYNSFINEPEAHIEEHKDYILSQFWFAMRKHGAKDNPGPGQLGFAFAMVLYDLMNDKKVQDSNF